MQLSIVGPSFRVVCTLFQPLHYRQVDETLSISYERMMLCSLYSCLASQRKCYCGAPAKIKLWDSGNVIIIIYSSENKVSSCVVIPFLTASHNHLHHKIMCRTMSGKASFII